MNLANPTRLCCIATLLTFLLIHPLATAAAEPLPLGPGTHITFTTPAPIIDNEAPLPAPAFDANGRATLSGLVLTRAITPLPDNAGYTIKLSITNNRSTPIHLRSLIPLQITGQQNILVAGQSVSDWTIFRMARHKNDIPGPFRPTIENEASRDASTDNSGGIKETDDPAEVAARGISYHSDPGFIITVPPIVNHKLKTENCSGSAAVFLGFDGQTEHLSDISLTLDSTRTALRTITATAEFDGVLVPPGATRATHTLYIQTTPAPAATATNTLLAAHVARIKARYGSRQAPFKNVFCTWYFYGPEIIAADIRSDLADLKKRPVKFDSFLIDYNWDDLFGDWNADTARFPEGMAAIATEIRAAGLIPGIWSCPFFIDPKAEILKKYPDLPLKNNKGECITSKTMPFMDFCYVLDPTAPNAEAFLTEICQRFRAWGYDYLKFDFLRIVLLDENAVFHDPTKNRAQAFKHGIDIIRRAAGDDATIGIWGALYEGCAGFADIMRSGSDVRGHWAPLDPSQPATRYPLRMRQTFARAFYDHAALWTSDQDALQLRRRSFSNPWRTTRPHISMGNFTDEEAFSLVAYRFLGGGIIQVSEKLSDLDQDRHDLYKMVIPTYAPPAQINGNWSPADYVPEHFITHFPNPTGTAAPTVNREPRTVNRGGSAATPSWSILTLANWNGNAAKTLSVALADIPGLPPAPAYAAFEFKTQTYLGIYKPADTISHAIPAHGARVIRLTPLTKNNATYLIGTDLNMSNGMEIAAIDGTRATLRPELREFPATFTFLEYKNGKATITKTSTTPHRPTKSTSID